MTRETKIGMLVGLAFIIVIGVIISDHFSSAMKPPEPKLQSGALTDSAITSPGGTSGSDRSIRLGDGRGPGNRLQLEQTPPPPVPPRADRTAPTPGGTAGTGGAGAGVSIRGSNPTPMPPETPGRGLVDVPGTEDHMDASPGTQYYTVKPGDTVSRLAKTFLGSNSVANQEKVMRLNPSLGGDARKLRAGERYLVPDLTVRTASNVPPSSLPPLSPLSPLAPTLPPSPERTPFTPLVAETPAPALPAAAMVYTTQPGDTLWKIARDQVGNASMTTVNQIKAMNADVLKGKDDIRPNMKLNLPGRPALASR